MNYTNEAFFSKTHKYLKFELFLQYDKQNYNPKQEASHIRINKCILFYLSFLSISFIVLKFESTQNS